MVQEINDEMIGWHFTPTDQNLIEILQKWVQGDCFPELCEVQFLDFEPYQLPAVSVLKSKDVWYFLVRRYMDMEINTCVFGGGSWRLFDETNVKQGNGILNMGMKRHYLFSESEEIFWVAYEYRLPSRNTVGKQSPPNEAEHAVIRLSINREIDTTAHFRFIDEDIVDMLVKRNQGQEFPEFGIVRFFHKEPYQLAALKPGEKRIYVVHSSDFYNEFDRWVTPRGKWKTVGNTPLSYIQEKKEGKVVGTKTLRKYYDHYDKPTEWDMYEYYTTDQVHHGIAGDYFPLVIFIRESDNSAPEKAPDHIASPQSARVESAKRLKKFLDKGNSKVGQTRLEPSA